MKSLKRTGYSRGYALVTVILLITMFVILGVAFMFTSQQNVQQSVAVYETDKHYYAAESAVQVAAQELKAKASIKMRDAINANSFLANYTFTSEIGVGPDAGNARLEETKTLYNNIHGQMKEAIKKAYNEMIVSNILTGTFNGYDIELPVIATDTEWDEVLRFEGLINENDVYNKTTNTLNLPLATPIMDLKAKSGGREVSITVTFDFKHDMSIVDGVGDIFALIMGRGSYAYYKDEGGDEGDTNFYNTEAYWILAAREYLKATTGVLNPPEEEVLNLAMEYFAARDITIDPTIPKDDALATEAGMIYKKYRNFKEAEFWLFSKSICDTLDFYKDLNNTDPDPSKRKAVLELLFGINSLHNYNSLPEFYNSLGIGEGTNNSYYIESDKTMEYPSPFTAMSGIKTEGNFTINGNNTSSGFPSTGNNPAVFNYLEYLYVEGNLTILGNVSCPNLKGVYVGGDLYLGTIFNYDFDRDLKIDHHMDNVMDAHLEARYGVATNNKRMTFKGSTRTGGTRFYVQGNTQIVPSGEQTGDVKDAQIFCMNNITMTLCLADGRDFYGNAVLMSAIGGRTYTDVNDIQGDANNNYNNAIIIAHSNTDTQIGNADMAPQIITYHDLDLLLGSRYYGIYALGTPRSDNGAWAIADGSGNTANLTGLFIGLVSGWQINGGGNKIVVNPGDYVDPEGLIESDFKMFLNQEFANVARPTDMIHPPPVVKIQYPAGIENALSLKSIDSLRETTGID
jgi:Tfp pilus assembly protein PilX